MGAPSVALAAMLLELVFGYPGWLYRWIGHPVGWAAALLNALEQTFNRPLWNTVWRRVAGVAALVLLLLAAGGAAVLLDSWLPTTGWGFCIRSVVAASLLAPKTLRDHVAAVANALCQGGVEAGRIAVSRIVGRDPAQLDESGICRAAIESLAENFSDGVIAPLFWYLAGGLAGIALYKAINTADSLVGHRTEQFEAFGWAAARLDDGVNLPASRLTALLIAIAAPDLKAVRLAIWIAWRDAGLHRSPNAGWPEAAMAGALDLALVGPRIYAGHIADDPWLGQGRRSVQIDDVQSALRLYNRAIVLTVTLLAISAML